MIYTKVMGHKNPKPSESYYKEGMVSVALYWLTRIHFNLNL